MSPRIITRRRRKMRIFSLRMILTSLKVRKTVKRRWKRVTLRKVKLSKLSWIHLKTSLILRKRRK